MKSKLKISLLVSSLAAICVLGSACGPSRPGVTVVSGGYYIGGVYYSGVYSSGGIITSSGGSSGGIITSSGGVVTSGGSGGVVTSGGSGGVVTSGGSGGVVTSGGSGGVVTSGGSGGVVTSGGSGGGSNGGSNGYSVNAGSGPALVGDCTSVDGCVAAAGNIAVPSSLLGTDSSLANSVDTDTKDVDLQRAELQGQNMDAQAQSISGQFGMSFESARQLAQLADKMSTLSASGSVSEEAREEIAHAALAVAGISTDDVNSAIASVIKDGDQKAVSALMDKAAANLGMTSSAGLRDQLLPTLGINF
jgi:hypothetical protein